MKKMNKKEKFFFGEWWSVINSFLDDAEYYLVNSVIFFSIHSAK